ncbi:hypothetical protein J3Q64DRAFT_1705661, partial [Phycomyces blakesleeanus]
MSSLFWYISEGGTTSYTHGWPSHLMACPSGGWILIGLVELRMAGISSLLLLLLSSSSRLSPSSSPLSSHEEYEFLLLLFAVWMFANPPQWPVEEEEADEEREETSVSCSDWELFLRRAGAIFLIDDRGKSGRCLPLEEEVVVVVVVPPVPGPAPAPLEPEMVELVGSSPP